MPAAGLIGGPLRALVRIACARPVATVLVAVALAIASVVYSLQYLSFSTSMRALLPPGRPYVERYTQYEREFGDLDSIAIVVEAPSLPEATLYANRLVRQLRAENVPLKRIAYRIDPKQFEGRGLLYLSKERLTNIRDAIFDYQEFMEAFAAHPTLDQLADGMATQIATAFMTNFIDLGLSEGKGAADLTFVQDLVALIGSRLDRPVRTNPPSARSSRSRARTIPAPDTSCPRTSACSSSWPSPRPSAEASPATSVPSRESGA